MPKTRPSARGRRSKSSAATRSAAVVAAATAPPICPGQYCGCPTMRSRSAPAARRNSGWDAGNTIVGASTLRGGSPPPLSRSTLSLYIYVFFSLHIPVSPYVTPHCVSVCMVVYISCLCARAQLLRSDFLRGLLGVLGGIARRKTVPAGAAVWPVLPQCDDQNTGQ